MAEEEGEGAVVGGGTAVLLRLLVWQCWLWAVAVVELVCGIGATWRSTKRSPGGAARGQGGCGGRRLTR